jgi:hypothetical protein
MPTVTVADGAWLKGLPNRTWKQIVIYVRAVIGFRRLEGAYTIPRSVTGRARLPMGGTKDCAR